MDSSPVSPRLALIQLHPIKALDSVHVKEARIGPGGGLELDRAWALYSADGQWVNGKRTPAVHLIRAAYAPDLTAVSLSVPGDRRGVPTSTFCVSGRHGWRRRVVQRVFRAADQHPVFSRRFSG